MVIKNPQPVLQMTPWPIAIKEQNLDIMKIPQSIARELIDKPIGTSRNNSAKFKKFLKEPKEKISHKIIIKSVSLQALIGNLYICPQRSHPFTRYIN